nr:transglycosylase SLT domain-containing protein [Chromobacterium sphagni]
MDPKLLHAIIKVESGYRPQAISSKGPRADAGDAGNRKTFWIYRLDGPRK